MIPCSASQRTIRPRAILQMVPFSTTFSPCSSPKTQVSIRTLAGRWDSTARLYEAACGLLDACWDLTPLRLIGLRVTRICETGCGQMSLFDNGRTRKLQEAERAVDCIRQKYGVDSIRRASFLCPDTLTDHAAGKQKHLT